jgi:Membrane transporters of cations and cationic drugs
MKYLYLALAVGFNVSAYILLKRISGRGHDVVWGSLFGIGLALGAVNVYFFTRALAELQLAVAYPAFAGAGIALVVLASALLFQERISAGQGLGAAVVVLGIVLLTR